MMYFALSLGVVGGFLAANKFIDHILMLAYYFQYRSEIKYKELYHSLEDELYFELMKDHPGAPKSYDKYLLLCQQKEETAFRVFRQTYRDVAILIVKVYGAGLLLSAVFYKYWPFLLVPFVLVHIGFFVERKIAKHYDRHFYLMMTHMAVLDETT